MKVFLKKDIPQVGFSGEIVKVTEGYARNFLFPRDLAVEITAHNEEFYKNKIKVVENRKEAVATETSMLAEKIKTLKVTLNRKMHDDGKLYGSISPAEVVDLLAEKGESVGKSQIEFDGGKLIKSTGTYEITIKLSSKLQPKIKLSVIAE